MTKERYVELLRERGHIKIEVSAFDDSKAVRHKRAAFFSQLTLECLVQHRRQHRIEFGGGLRLKLFE
jgi:hypothetical protein